MDGDYDGQARKRRICIMPYCQALVSSPNQVAKTPKVKLQKSH